LGEHTKASPFSRPVSCNPSCSFKQTYASESQRSCEKRLELVDVEIALDNQFLEPTVLLLELFEPFDVIRTQIAKLLAPTEEPTQMIELLCEIRGIGPWTAHYIAMRALAWRDAWLPGDVALQTALGLPNNAAGRRAALNRANTWQPWRSYGVLHLWRMLARQPNLSYRSGAG